MKKILLVLTILCSYSLVFGQSFEGKLTYKVEFELKAQEMGGMEITQEQVMDHMKEKGEYFDVVTITLKDGNYVKEDNSSLTKRMVYKAEENKIYNFEKDFDHVVITDANKVNSIKIETPAPQTERIDSTKLVLNYECKLVKLSWGNLGEELYYYNADVVKIDPELFSKHNYEYFNTVLEITKSYPLEIIKTVNDFISVKMTLVKIEEEPIEDSVFALPKLKKAKKDYADLMRSLTGAEVMKIKD